MITLSYLWRWLRLAGLAVLALVVERAVIVDTGHLVLAAAVTVGLLLLITVGLYREWRAHAAGYYEIGSRERR